MFTPEAPVTTIAGELSRRDRRGRKAHPVLLKAGEKEFAPEYLERINLEIRRLQREAVDLATEIEIAKMNVDTTDDDPGVLQLSLDLHVKWTLWQCLVRLKKKMLTGTESAQLSLLGTIRQLKGLLGPALLAELESPKNAKASADAIAAREHLREFCRLVPLLGFSHEEMELGTYSGAFREADLEVKRKARAQRHELENDAFLARKKRLVPASSRRGAQKRVAESLGVVPDIDPAFAAGVADPEPSPASENVDKTQIHGLSQQLAESAKSQAELVKAVAEMQKMMTALLAARPEAAGSSPEAP